jgi:aryl carrier-like protein
VPLFSSREDAISKTRAFIRDNPNTNALLDGYETDDTLIGFCVDLAMDDFNSTPPLIGNYELVTHPSQSLILICTVLWILKSAGLMQSRNQLDYASGGITIATSNKTPLYQSWINLLMQEYEAKKANLKKAINAEQAYGGIGSEYTQVNFGGNLMFMGLDSVNLVRNGIFV